jgi:hypothetical protein
MAERSDSSPRESGADDRENVVGILTKDELLFEY